MMEPTPLYMLSCLTVSPRRCQFFEYESVSLSCEEPGSSAGVRVRRNTTEGKSSECGADWGIITGSSCYLKDLYPGDSGVYWCESESGEHSHAVNFTVHDGAVILESPVLPVNQGQAVTLRCRYQTPPSNLTAAFYKDGSVVRTEAAGEMTIPAVSTSDAGLYRCSNSELGGSPESWLAVRAPPLGPPPTPSLSPSPAPPPGPYPPPSLSPSPAPPPSSPPPPAPLLSLPRLLCSILVTCPYLVVTVLLLEMCCRSRGGTFGEQKRNCDDVIE
ncbi:Fc receptor-like A isoform X2 [Hypomesus transpacificus]|uniref:Fc receptor-like A isoform X2 n=1 Tax=Hypomesus transpacificus TaxID=137520 RepID=UPI001F07851F|nr:Fc receptor-like A isoform X2 [Hypomesus transpacificus]